jgi:HAD superfamily hydrolase (TIGR01509 family)
MFSPLDKQQEHRLLPVECQQDDVIAGTVQEMNSRNVAPAVPADVSGVCRQCLPTIRFHDFCIYNGSRGAARLPAQPRLAMVSFYFDVGGVLIPDKLAPDNARNVFMQLAKRHRFDPDHAHAKYSELQPSLDLGVTSLTELCSALGIEQKVFEQHWLAIHPADVEVIRTVERLLAKGHAVGLATNFCRRLLNLLIENTPPLSGLAVCCSSDIGLVKPSAEFFRRATEIMRSQEIVFIDDRGVNVEAARRFGWTSIQASEGWLARFRNTYFPGAQSC